MSSLVGPLTGTLAALLIALGPAERLESAVDAANNDPETGAPALALTLDEVTRAARAQLRSAASLRDQRLDALLVLARAWLAAGDGARAAAAMDEALRSAGSTGVDASRLGPTLARFQERRVEALEKKALPAGLELRCDAPCRVFLNEQPVELPVPPLPPGTYRLHVESDGGELSPLDTEVTLSEGGLESVRWGEPEGPVAVADPPELPAPADEAGRTRERLLPRWAEIAGMVVGAAGVGAGAALLTLDGKCPGGGDPSDGEACPDLYETTAPAIASMAVGGALLLSGTILLSVDEVRLRKNERAAGVSVRIRF